MKIVIIGTGAAGTAAANAVLEQLPSAEVVLVEAAERTGGRTRTVEVGAGCPMDLGASWIESSGLHKKDRTPNPMAVLAEKYGIPFGCPKINRRSTALDEEDGGEEPNEEEEAEELHCAAMQHATKVQRALLRDLQAPDRSLRAVYEEVVTMPPRGSKLRRWVDFHASMGEQYYGDSFRNLSCRYYGLPSGYSGRDKWVTGGFGNVVRAHLGNAMTNYPGRCSLTVSTPVTRVEERADGRKVVLHHSEGALEADYAIITVPLGVLKAGAVSFDPPLPETVANAVRDLGWGLMNKVVFRFTRQFWKEDLGYFGVACGVRGRWRSWFVPFADEPVLMCIVAAAFAAELEEMTDEEAKRDGCSVLKSAFCVSDDDFPDVVDFRFSRWRSDPHTRGGYSSLTTTSSPSTVAAFQQPCFGGRLLFAGEHTDPVDYCSVHGAHNSGLRAAKQVIEHSAAAN